MGSGFNFDLSKKTHIFHLKVWVLVTIFLGIFILLVLLLLWCCIARKTSRKKNTLPISLIPDVSGEIKEIRIDQNSANHVDRDSDIFNVPEKYSEKDSDKLLVHFKNDKEKNDDGSNQCGSFNCLDKDDSALESGTRRDLEVATNKFSKDNIIGEGGYGIVYRGQLINGATVAVKRLLNNLGQAEKEFRVEVEAIGHVRHKNLVRLLGYCIEGTHRLLVYEYVNNGNLEQWLHGAMSHHGHLTWEGRMKILLGTAKAYVAPEYASSGFLNEKSDVYSFGVVLVEAITGRDPVDDSLPVHEKNLVDWLKMMVAAKRSEEVVDPNLETRPSTSALKRALLTALRGVEGKKRNIDGELESQAKAEVAKQFA
ncbi:UNVERIFIED_CONTAM: putative receptor-like protein kinase [Sesamum radiatum]|uniref:non-specific serine/threonine protein kinase n=1 Tax=Sesamum radiatum TaxID=300843 RepID=A0AAW2QJ47_SESRA